MAAWTLRTIRARYQQSLLGGLWAVFQPAATVVVFTIVFTFFIHVDTAGVPYVVFSFSAMVPWLLFSSSVTDMVESIVGNMNLVSKIYFPRQILVIAAMLARLMDFFIGFGVLIVLMFLYQIPLFTKYWLYLPLIIAIELALALGLGLIGSALNVFYRDIRHLIALILQLWLYATPIIYPVSVVPERFLPIYFLNPMAGAIVAYRAVLVYGTTPTDYLYLSGAAALVTLVLGFWIFKRLEYKFADVV